jgi:hypothetical protein
MGTRYQTHCITVYIRGNGKVEVNGDHLLPTGEMECAELQEALARLHREGWILVSSIDRKHLSSPYGAMELYFRKEILETA